MSDIFDHYYDSFPDEMSWGDPWGTISTKTCRYCGATGLEWIAVGPHWRLGRFGLVHVCETMQVAQDNGLDELLNETKIVLHDKNA